MEHLQGKRSEGLDAAHFRTLVSSYEGVLVDIGTGDGRYVLHEAGLRPGWLAIGLDASRDRLRDASRKAPPNALFLIGNALGLLEELVGVSCRITINFPWGSLLSGLLDPAYGLITGLRSIARPDAAMELRLNEGALHEHGCGFEDGVERIAHNVSAAGFRVEPTVRMNVVELRRFPTTWARKLGYGRETRVSRLRACRRR